jgi:hypothetical protein
MLQLLAIQWAPLAGLLGAAPLGLRDWVVVSVLGVTPGVVGQLVRTARSLRSRALQSSR